MLERVLNRRAGRTLVSCRPWHAAAAELAEALPQAAFSTLRSTLASAPDPALLHPVLRTGR